MFDRLPAWLVMLLLAAACESTTTRGRTLYAEGNFIEAAAYFERREASLGEASASERAEYGLYRGMTLLALGDLRRARYWLDYAYQVNASVPGSLSGDARTLLDQSYAHLNVQQQREDRRQLPGEDSRRNELEPAPAMSAQVPTDSDTRRGLVP